MDPAELRSPIFIVAAPRSGEGVLYQSIARASGIWHGRAAFDDVGAIDPSERGWDSHRLSAADLNGQAADVRERLTAQLVDREGRPATAASGPVRGLSYGPRLALRIPFLAAAFPDARFVYVFREPAEATAEMLAAWNTGNFVAIRDLPGWDGPPWSLPLVPGWRELNGKPLEQIVAEQWRIITETALDDLQQLEPERWGAVGFDDLLEDPRRELRRLCGFLDVPYDQALLSPVEVVRRRRGRSEPAASVELDALLPSVAEAAVRARELLAEPDPSVPKRREKSPFHSVSTGSFAKTLGRLGSTLLVSTYQTGRLILGRERDGLLNTHFRNFDKPMGIAVGPSRFALGTRTEIWDFRDLPALAPKIEPPGTHDACFLPRNRHTTGDVLVHEMAFAGGELWVVATAFSCLATIDADHSFVPRWKPPFISAIQPGDRCHLNGLAVIDDRPAYVTTLGRTDEPGGWRANKASGGCIIDLASSETVMTGLSMPHSPRWHDGALWVLESGRGTLARVDLDSGTTEPVVELPGFARGLAFAGDTAFVGLSQIRESSTFGDLPITEKLQERVCGVWMVDLKRGRIAGFLRFEDLVQEIFDVALLPGTRYPEVAEPGSAAVTSAFTLP